MNVHPVSHIDFKAKLKGHLNDAGNRQVVIGVRVDGSATDANIFLRIGADAQHWRVGTRGGRQRIDTWNLVQEIARLTTDHSDFPSDIQATYERGVNEVRAGWVLLYVKGRRAASARVVGTLTSVLP